ncbi:hypothetical protein G6F57_022795 [Rhizopus arrhizus]|nr:hypothetical protein G6F57_022795 [Rhizopus arrhizus]
MEDLRSRSGSPPARILRPGQLGTMEYNATRLNLIVDDKDVMTAIRWAGLSATTDPALIAALQLLQCFTLAGNNAAIMWYITRHVPAACKTWAARCTAAMHRAASS